ncbi:tRNA nucleotidyltransferase [Desulfovibrionales bacterium]
MKLYRVGGAVRDKFLGRDSADQDFVLIGGTEDDLQRLVPGLTRVGRGIPVFVHGQAQYTCSAFASIEADLASRDLTLNALAQDEHGQVLAYPGALDDLRAKVLRPVAVENFLHDPLRVVRAARFSAQFPDFTVSPELVAAMRCVDADRLAQVAAERVGQEVVKACAALRPGNFLRLLSQTDCLAPWLAEWTEAANIPAGPPAFHASSVLEHTAAVMDHSAGSALQVWMAWCHDIGKTTTPEEILPRHLGHEVRGQDMAVAFGTRLRLPKTYLRAGRLAAAWHMSGAMYPSLRPSTRVRLLLDVDKAGIMDEFFGLVRADGDEDHGTLAHKELGLIKAARLPAQHRNQGEKSAAVLLSLRCAALSQHHDPGKR